ncbi:MAG TPA: YceI family protein [Dehalococcoidia bacterium]|nr:YceI family protein [Dehalococcoidia bacterium]
MTTGSTTWTIDKSHTSVEFAVRHMGLATVRGRFRSVDGTVETGPDGAPRAIEARIDAASIDTGDARRDEHLRSADFLDAQRYPTLVFRSTRIAAETGGRYRVDGHLTIRDETRPVSFEVEVTRPVTDPWGYLRAGATARGTLNRKDWGLTWNQALEFGALLVGEEIRFAVDVEVVAAARVAA